MDIELNDQIDRYCKGMMTLNEKLEFEKRMHQDPVLKEEVQLHEDLMGGIENHFSQALKDKLKQSDQLEKSPKKGGSRNFFNPLAVAAAISLLLVAGYFLMDTASPAELYQTYYQPYPNIINPVSRSSGASAATDKDKAMIAYEQADYQTAIQLFGQAEQPLESSYQFYQALSYLELSQYADALSLLKVVEKSGIQAYHFPSLWYQGMAYLALEKVEDARLLLQKLSESNDSFYSKKAREVLSEL